MKAISIVSAPTERSGSKAVFIGFCVWTVVLLSRPQDYVAWLAVFRPALLVGVLVVILYVLNHDRYNLKFTANRQCRLFGFLVLMMLISVPFAIYRRAAFKFLFETYIHGICFFYLFYKIVDDEEKLKTLLWLACLGAGIYSIVALRQGGQGDLNRLEFGQFFDPNDLAFFAVSLFPLNFLFLQKDNPFWKRLACSVNAAVGILLILMTGSRGGGLALGVVILVLLFTRTLTVKRSYKIVTVALILVLLMFGGSVINFARLGTITHLEEDYNIWDETGRLAVWKKGFELMVSRPLIGVGVGCFNEAVGQDRAKRGLQEQWQAPHNSLVQIGAETGIVGLILFVLLSYNAFRIFGKAKRIRNSEWLVRLGEMSKIAFCGHFVASMFLSQAYSIYWLFYIMLSAVLIRHESEALASAEKAILVP